MGVATESLLNGGGFILIDSNLLDRRDFGVSKNTSENHRLCPDFWNLPFGGKGGKIHDTES